MSEDPPVPSLDADPAETLSFRYEIDEDEPPSHALVAVTLAVTGAAPTEIDPLGRHVDLEAMDELLASNGGGTLFPASVVLTAEGLSIAVGSDEIVGVARRGVADWSSEGS